MAILTIGEMVAVPTAQGLVANLAPENMRGRYMAVAGLAWTIPFAVGTYLAGLIMDNTHPAWVWYAAAILCSITFFGYIWLHRRDMRLLCLTPTKLHRVLRQSYCPLRAGH